MIQWLLFAVFCAQTIISPAQLRSDHSQTSVDSAQTLGTDGTQIAREQIGGSVSTASDWWSLDVPSGAYQYVGPSCWADGTTLPSNCDLRQWWTLDGSTNYKLVSVTIACEEPYLQGIGNDGGVCHDPTDGCNSNGTSTVIGLFKDLGSCSP